MPELETYRRKRDPRRTAEPVPPPGPLPRGHDDTFVVQEHHATALHWDFRLERDGVLVSWAVPKGIPQHPKRNHLAVHTEDHPLDYAGFAGEIAKGEYGGGSVQIWDRGSYETEKWTDREVKVVLHGQRVQGRYVLFRTDGKNWMMHRMDPPTEGTVPVPEMVRPMLAVAREELPPDGDWAYEFKWDGVRAVVYVEGGRAKVLSRNDKDVTVSYPELREMAAALGTREVVLDGEIVAFDANGRPSFGALQGRMHVTTPARVRTAAAATPATFLAFDVLHLDGRSTLDLPYRERRQLLESLHLDGASWATPPSFSTDGAAVLAASKERGLEGVVAKRLDSRYTPGKRSDAWLKVKHIAMQEVVVGGWKPGEGRRAGGIGSLLLGVNDDEGFTYVGHVGTGFTEKMLAELAARLRPLARKTTPFANAMATKETRDAHWVTPRLVGEVTFTEWTKDGRLRHPAWRGLREDKTASEVTRESQ